MFNRSCRLICLFFILFAFLVTGCVHSWRSPRPSPNPTYKGIAFGAVSGGIIGAISGAGAPAGAIIGAAVGGIIANHLSLHHTIVDAIQSNGVHFIVIGDNLTFVLPSDRFFNENTPILNRNYYEVLDQIAFLIGSFDKYSVMVAGYTDNQNSTMHNIALSRDQAVAVANYLWKRGIDTRVMMAMGYGEANPIANNITSVGQSMNRRVEITMRLFHEPDGEF